MSNPNLIFHQMWCWVSWLLNGLAGEWHSPVFFKSTTVGKVRLCLLGLVLGVGALSPTEVGALSVAAHPYDRQRGDLT